MTAAKRKLTHPAGRHRLPRLSKAEGFTLHPFDLANGVNTSGLIPGRFLKTGHAHDRHSTAYFGVAPSVFHSLLRRWQRTKPSASLQDFTFVDIGAGMGRAMLLASEYPFRSIMGVELNPALVRIARRNLKTWGAEGCAFSLMQIVQDDVLDFRIPEGPCLFFLFNPFGGSVMRRLLARLARAFKERPNELDLLYVNNEQERIVERQSGFARLYLGQVRRSRNDAIADYRIMANQPDGEYASANYEHCSIWRWMGQTQN